MSVNQSGSVQKSICAAIAVALGTTMLAAVPHAVAADASSTAVLEEVTVTGSRIKRPDLESSSPLVTIDAEQLEQRSNLNIESYLNQLPNFNPAAAPTTAANLDVQISAVNSVGISSVSLYGFGPNRNLVLVDGHRATPINALMVVDINSIPAAMIQRVDIVSGGASAVYGADAMAGVVNFILRKDFQGLEVDFQDGITQAGDGQEMRASAIMGTKISDGRGNITFGTEYYDRRAAWARNRSFYTKGWGDPNAASGDLFLFGFNGYQTGIAFGGFGQNPTGPAVNAVNGIPAAAGCPQNPGAGTCLYGNANPGFLYGIFTSTRFNANGTPLPQAGNWGPYFSGTVDGKQYAYQNNYDSSYANNALSGAPPPVVQTIKYNDQLRYASSPQTRYSFFSNGTFDITDKVQAFANARYAESDTQTILIPTNASYGWEVQVPYNATTDSPINPAIDTFGATPATLDAIAAAFKANPTNNAYTNPNFIPTGTKGAQHPVPWQLAMMLNSRAAPPGKQPCNAVIAPSLSINCLTGAGTAAGPQAPTSWIGETYPLQSFPQRQTVDKSSVWQVETGLRFPLFADWTGEAYYSRGQSVDYNNAIGDNSLARWRAIMQSPDYGRGNTFLGNQNGASVGFGTTVPTTCASGFYNTMFMGDAVPSADCQNAVQAVLQTATLNEQDVFEANFSGSLFKLPAGEVGANVGYQFRRNSAQFNPDILQSSNSFLDQVIGVYPTGNLNAQTSVHDYYAEMLIPVLADVPGFKKLEFDIGGRYSNYKETSNATTFKINTNWDITKSFRIRGGFNRATRAPNLGELFLNEQELFQFGGNFGDPCALRSNSPVGASGNALNKTDPATHAAIPIAGGQTAAGALSTYLVCLAQMGASSTTASTASNAFYASATPSNGGGFAWVNQQGNPNLRSETADTWTGGLVMTSLSDSPWFSGMSAAIDYYKIDVKNAILLSSIDYANYLCYGTNTVTNDAQAQAQAQTPACLNAPRNLATGGATTQLLQYSNLARISTSGVQLDLNWLMQLSDIGFHAPGALSLSMQDAWLNYFRTKQSPQAFDVNTDWKGSLGPNLTSTQGGAYSYRLFTTIGYSLPSFNVNLRWRFLPSVNSAAHASQMAIIENNNKVAGGAPGQILSWTPNRDIAAKSYSQFDLSFGWTINKTFSLRAGIDNLLNKQPVITGAGLGFPTTLSVCTAAQQAIGCQNPTAYTLARDGAGTTNGGYYDVLGRSYYLGIKARF
jgi:iron complex outermembrane recepter protein